VVICNSGPVCRGLVADGAVEWEEQLCHKLHRPAGRVATEAGDPVDPVDPGAAGPVAVPVGRVAPLVAVPVARPAREVAEVGRATSAAAPVTAGPAGVRARVTDRRVAARAALTGRQMPGVALVSQGRGAMPRPSPGCRTMSARVTWSARSWLSYGR
jgi:hypothetical protein